jgi:hypothetical protein
MPRRALANVNRWATAPLQLCSAAHQSRRVAHTGQGGIAQQHAGQTHCKGASRTMMSGGYSGGDHLRATRHADRARWQAHAALQCLAHEAARMRSGDDAALPALQAAVLHRLELSPKVSMLLSSGEFLARLRLGYSAGWRAVVDWQLCCAGSVERPLCACAMEARANLCLCRGRSIRLRDNSSAVSSYLSHKLPRCGGAGVLPLIPAISPQYFLCRLQPHVLAACR